MRQTVDPILGNAADIIDINRACKDDCIRFFHLCLNRQQIVLPRGNGPRPGRNISGIPGTFGYSYAPNPVSQNRASHPRDLLDGAPVLLSGSIREPYCHSYDSCHYTRESSSSSFSNGRVSFTVVVRVTQNPPHFQDLARGDPVHPPGRRSQVNGHEQDGGRPRLYLAEDILLHTGQEDLFGDQLEDGLVSLEAVIFMLLIGAIYRVEHRPRPGHMAGNVLKPGLEKAFQSGDGSSPEYRG